MRAFATIIDTMKLALIAHDGRKDAMIALAGDFLPLLRRCQLVATGTTGTRLAAAHGLTLERMLSGPMGGDLQIGEIGRAHV